MNRILDIILTNTYTLSDLKHRLRILKEYLETRFFNKTGPNEISPADSKWFSTLSKDFFDQFNKDNFSQIFERLEKEIDKITPLVIYLSFDIDEQIKTRISSWLRQNLTQKIIFETRFDPNLIGGVALTFNGIYKDYSLRSKINEQKELILQEFKNYIT